MWRLRFVAWFIRQVSWFMAAMVTFCNGQEEPPPPVAPSWDVRVVRIQANDRDPFCPVGVGTALALLMGPWRFGAGETPRLNVAVGCERVGRCVDVHAAVGLVVTSSYETDALFEGASVHRAGCAPWPLSIAFEVVGTIRAVYEGLAMAYDQYRVLRTSDREVLAILEAGRPRGALLQAIVEAGDRRIREAVPSLTRLLDSGDAAVVLRAVAALGRIRDEAALRPLGRVALSEMPDVPYAALQAIADIGGEEARRVLEVVAEQTQSPVVAKEARELLDDLRRRQR